MNEATKSIFKERSQHKCFCRIGYVGKDWTCTLHWHEHYEICRVMEGRMRFLVDGVSYNAEKGDLVCIDTAVPHISYSETARAAFRLFKCSPSVFLQISPSVKTLKPYISHTQIRSVEGLEEELLSAFEMLSKRTPVLADETKPFEQAVSAAVYFLLAEHFAEEDEARRAKSKERQIFFKTLEYVNAHFTEPINVNVLAERLFYSRGRLSAVFAKYSGSRLGDYINALRIQRVNELITSGTSITEAAFLSGFQNIRSFNNVYKDVMGISPSEYIKGNI